MVRSFVRTLRDHTCVGQAAGRPKCLIPWSWCCEEVLVPNPGYCPRVLAERINRMEQGLLVEAARGVTVARGNGRPELQLLVVKV